MAGWRCRRLLIPVVGLAAVPFLHDWVGPSKPDAEAVEAPSDALKDSPHDMRLAEGRAARAPGAEAAALMQRIVCDVVTGYPKAGVAP